MIPIVLYNGAIMPVKEASIECFLQEEGWIADVDSVSFLAAGEYNENYLVRAGDDAFVFRINHGSQLELENQIEYEFKVLQAVETSRVTPRPFYCMPAPNSLNAGVLLMEYLAGIKLDYRRDWRKAARVFARIHALPAPEGLIVQANPVRDIARESLRLINTFDPHPLTRHRRILLAYHADIVALEEKAERLFANEPMCIVNTEVNSSNFIVAGEKAFLVDWEKAVVSCRYQDLGHFLVPTTTLWKSNDTYSGEEKLRFLRAYREMADTRVSLDELRAGTKLLERTILLRALSWCFMAYYEYTQAQRSLRNQDTFLKIKKYMDDIECFLN